MGKILTPDDQLFFMHIPKTAGTSFTHILQNKFEYKDIFTAHSWSAARERSKKERSACRLFYGHMQYTFADQLDRPVVVTMMRHPIERCLSHFAQLQRSGRTELLSTHNVPSWQNVQDNAFYKYWHDGISLEEYLDQPDLRIEVENLQTRYLGARRSVDYRWQHPQKSRKLPTPIRFFSECALNRLESCAYFGLTEHFSESIDLLTFTFGWPPENELQSLNVVEDLHRSSISSEALERLRSLNSADIELYRAAEIIFHRRLSEMRKNLLSIEYSNRFDLVKTASVDLKSDSPFPGVGWQAFDSHNPNFRWTGPSTESNLDLPLVRDQTLHLSFRIVDAICPDILSSFHVRVNGKTIQLNVQSHPVGGIHVTSVLDPSMLISDAPYTRISFHVARTVRPSDLSSQSLDDRALGVAIAELTISSA